MIYAKFYEKLELRAKEVNYLVLRNFYVVL